MTAKKECAHEWRPHYIRLPNLNDGKERLKWEWCPKCKETRIVGVPIHEN